MFMPTTNLIVDRENVQDLYVDAYDQLIVDPKNVQDLYVDAHDQPYC